jgi:hypothetical protein
LRTMESAPVNESGEIMEPTPALEDLPPPPAATLAEEAGSVAEEHQTLFVPVPVDTDFEGEMHSWAAFTKHVENLLKMMETCIWPVDPDADVYPHTVMPLVYRTESGEEDEETLKQLMFMLTLGLQGEAFKWKYKFD